MKPYFQYSILLRSTLFSAALLFLSLQTAYSQVEKVFENNQVLTASSGALTGSYYPMSTLHFDDNSRYIVNNRLVFSANGNFSWVIDTTGNLLTVPDLGSVTDLGNGRWISQGWDRTYVIDTSNFERIPLFDEKAYRLGTAQNGIQLIAEGDHDHKKLWACDGDPDNLILLVDDFKTSKSTLTNAMTHDGFWSFVDADGQLYLSDGTADGTQVIRDMGQEMEVVGMTNQFIILYADKAFRSVPYDGSAVIGLISYANHASFSRGNTNAKINLNNKVIFLVQTGSKGEVLWSTDGTSNGNKKLITLSRFFPRPYHTPIIRFGDKAHLFIDDYTDDRLLETDGTVPGTLIVEEKGKGLRNLFFHGQFGEDQMAYVFRGWTETPGLWLLIDGELKNCTPGPGLGWGLEQRWHTNRYFEVAQNHVYYMALHPEAGRELHRTNSAGVSELVIDLTPGTGWSDIILLGQLGPWFYFANRLPNGTTHIYRVRDDKPVNAEIPASTSMFEWSHTLLPMHNGLASVGDVLPRDLILSGDSILYSIGYTRGKGIASSNSPMFESLVWSSPELFQGYQARVRENTFYLARMNAHTGKPTWLKTLRTGAEKSHLLRLAEAPNQGLYYSISSSISFCPKNSSIARLQSDGEEVWTISGDGGTQIHQLHTDEEGNLLASFWLAEEGLSFGGFPFVPALGSATSKTRLGLAKISPEGKVLWARELPESGLLTTRKCLVINNHIYLIYTTASQKMKLAILDTEWGDPIQLIDYNTTGSLVPTAISELADGRICLSALTSDSTRIGKFMFLTPEKEWRSLVITLSPHGNLLDIHAFEPNELIYEVAADHDNGYLAYGIITGFGAAETIDHLYDVNPGPYYRKLFNRFFVRSYNQEHVLHEEKSWLQHHNRHDFKLPFKKPDLQLLQTGSREYIVQHSYTGPLDTLQHTPFFHKAVGANTMRLHFTGLTTPDEPSLAETEPFSSFNIHLYPNPSSDILILHSQHPDFPDVPLYLFNSQGVSIPVSETSSMGQHRFLQVGNLPTGVYFVGTRLNGSWEVQRVLVHSSAR